MLKTITRAAAVAALAIAAPAAAVRDTPQFTSLVVFGDSLVDAGNINTLTGLADPTQGYYMGRFTNGYDYTDYLSLALFGSVTTASLAGGTNFAYGGARASATSPSPIHDLAAQLADYQAYLDSGHTVDRNGLYVLNFGANDTFNAPGDAAARDAFLQQAARDYAAGVQTLLNQGVRNLLVTGFPVLTDPISLVADQYLTADLAALTVAPDVTLDRFSYLAFFTRVTTNPASVGLTPLRTDITCRGAGAAVVLAGCPGIFSFDGIHPTAVVQQAIFSDLNRQFALTPALAAVPEPATWGLMVMGFALAGLGARRRADRGARRHALRARLVRPLLLRHPRAGGDPR